MLTTDKTSKYNLSTLNKVTHTTIGNILKSQNQIAAIFSDCPCDTTESGSYEHAFLIYSDELWLTKDSIITTVTIKNSDIYRNNIRQLLCLRRKTQEIQ